MDEATNRAFHALDCVRDLDELVSNVELPCLEIFEQILGKEGKSICASSERTRLLGHQHRHAAYTRSLANQAASVWLGDGHELERGVKRRAQAAKRAESATEKGVVGGDVKRLGEEDVLYLVDHRPRRNGPDLPKR